MHTPPATKELMEAAVEIARGAGEVTMQWFGRSAAALDVETKDDGSPVTVADKAAERFIREAIDRFAPGSTLVGEEEGSSQGTGALTWYIDPIDGTKGFARGVPLYATLLAVDDEHGPAVGVVYIPATREIVYAGRGLGAWTDGGPAHVSDTSTIASAYVTTSAVNRWGTGVYGRINDAVAEIRGWGDGYGFLMAATGRVDAMIDLHAGSVWDFAPMGVIFTEAGGRASALDGASNPRDRSMVASNGTLHEELLTLING